MKSFLLKCDESDGFWMIFSGILAIKELIPFQGGGLEILLEKPGSLKLSGEVAAAKSHWCWAVQGVYGTGFKNYKGPTVRSHKH